MATLHENPRPTSHEELQAARHHAFSRFKYTTTRTFGFETFSPTQAVHVGISIVRRHLSIAQYDARIAGGSRDTKTIYEAIDGQLKLQSVLTAWKKGNLNPLRRYFENGAAKYKEWSNDPKQIIQRDRILRLHESWKKIAQALPVSSDDSSPLPLPTIELLEKDTPATSEEPRTAREDAVTALSDTISEAMQRETFIQPIAILFGRIIINQKLTLARIDTELTRYRGGTPSMEYATYHIDKTLGFKRILTAAENGNYSPMCQYFEGEAKRYKDYSERPEEKAQKAQNQRLSETWQKIADALPAQPDGS